MEDKTVTITISKDGAITVDAEGFTGQSCEEATAFLDKLFQKNSTEYKKSFYELETNHLVDPLPSGYCG